MRRVKEITVTTTNGCRARFMNPTITERDDYLEIRDFGNSAGEHRACFPWHNIVSFSFTVYDSEVET